MPYRSSHQIRFTITTMLYEAGVPLNQLSTMLGHSETRTTLHYIRQQSVDPKSSTIMINTLDTIFQTAIRLIHLNKKSLLKLRQTMSRGK
ncbi:MAG: tyrosine-type recombinase/integrase [Blautia wexlerae]